MTEMSERCDCMTRVNGQLKEHNTKLATSFVLTKDLKGMDCLPLVQVEKIHPRRRGRPMCVVPTFCPFCGVKYPRMGEEGEGLPEAIAS